MIKNVIVSGEEDRSGEEILAAVNKSNNHEKIYCVLNNLNTKMTQFNEQRRQIEEEIRKGIHASTASLLSNSDCESDQEISEILTI